MWTDFVAYRRLRGTNMEHQMTDAMRRLAGQSILLLATLTIY